MSEQGISDLTPRIGRTTRTFDRLLPRGGIETERQFNTVSYKLLHMDVNDLSEGTRNSIGETLKKSWLSNNGVSSEHINTGIEIGRQFRIYDLIDSNVIVQRSFYEMLDNPHGYGIGDFFSLVLVANGYQNSRFLRAGSSDLYHIVFKTGLMRRIYYYVKMLDDVDPSAEPNAWKRVDLKASPCIGKIYPNTGPEVQRYFLFPKEIETEKGRYTIFEVNGDVYNGMDLKDYNIKVMEGTGSEWKNLDELMDLLDGHAKSVKRVAKFDFVRRRRRA